MTKRIYLWMLLSLFTFMGCESLEDTYSDYSGDGEIRYLGKCSDISITPGWRRLIVTWKNSVDPMIENIQVSWKLGDVTRDTILDKNATECSIPNLTDGNYEVKVCSIDKEKKVSKTIPIFSRPYTENHEVIFTFTRLISKFFFVEDRLALFFSSWQENVSAARLEYYTPTGELKKLLLSSELIGKKYHLLEEAIDPTKPVTLYREGRVEGCEDLIVFAPYKLLREKQYTSDFKQWIKAKYGLSAITESFENSQEELEFDYSIASFEDILYFPNLKKLILGKNRYLRPDMADSVAYSELYDLERSLFVLDVANKVYGITVDRYNKHYIEEDLPYITPLVNPELPEITYLDASDWDITCSQEDVGSYDSKLENLLDGDIKSFWQPEQYMGYSRTYEITVDMKESQTVNGVKVVQRSFDKGDAQSESFMPGLIKVKYSYDKATWQDATYVEENTLGKTNGESTIIKFSSPREAKCLKFIVNDQLYGRNFSVILAEIGVF